jgi:hypothetical protein
MEGSAFDAAAANDDMVAMPRVTYNKRRCSCVREQPALMEKSTERPQACGLVGVLSRFVVFLFDNLMIDN